MFPTKTLGAQAPPLSFSTPTTSRRLPTPQSSTLCNLLTALLSVISWHPLCPLAKLRTQREYIRHTYTGTADASDLLGEHFGTATSQSRRALLFIEVPGIPVRTNCSSTPTPSPRLRTPPSSMLYTSRSVHPLQRSPSLRNIY